MVVRIAATCMTLVEIGSVDEIVAPIDEPIERISPFGSFSDRFISTETWNLSMLQAFELHRQVIVIGHRHPETSPANT